ncbi:MAG TPA: calcium-binding protein [Candidatus Binatia bacterium]|nr:calcium-binding protein [Candidatus Binatia bacterium]
MRRPRGLSLVLGLALLVPLVVAPAAHAATCAFAGSTLTITYAANDVVTLAVSGSSITMNGAACGAATTANTNLITTAGTVTGNESLVLDLSGGALAPGSASEAGGAAEIEIRADLGALNDTVVLVGAAGTDAFDFGTVGLNLNDDDDADVTIVNVESIVVQTGAGNDRVSALGSGGSGGPLATPVVLQGGDGHDDLQGGTGADELAGGAGDDVLSGGDGNDIAEGGDGADTVRGDGGNDVLRGGGGDDALSGEDGADTVLGEPGATA